MNGQIDQLVRSLLEKDSLDQCSLQELEQFANRHPYFGAAQLLLTKKLQVENSAQYDEQLQKTFLFFHNPLWVQQLLNDTGKATVTVADRNEQQAVEAEPAPGEPPVVESETKVTEVSGHQDISAANEVRDESKPGMFTPPPFKESSYFAETVAEKEEDNPVPVEASSFPAETNVVNEVEQSVEVENDQLPAGTVTSDKEEKPVINEQLTVEQSPLPAEIVAEKENEKPVPVQAAREELLFEPYHTVDYFASQGIRIREEEKPTDKFGQQLRSFTDWLKSMKKLNVTEIVPSVEPAAEKKVEQMAAHSLEEREVFTEAMAEVWEKQGNREKASAIYHKLSLLDPSKSAYFAAKIEDLKK